MSSSDSNNQQPLPVGYEFSDLHLRVERVLGSGGFGITYLVSDLELNKERVLKENFPRNMAARSSGAAVGVSSSNLRENYDYLLAKFIQEGEALRRFASHPNIAQVLGIFQANNTAYVLMEYRPGQSLGEYIKNRGNRALDEEEIKSLCLPALNGLEAIHAGGLLHLDIKPDNIYLPMLGEPYLIDFGGARRFTSVDSQRLSRYSSMVHTPGYAPGEQSSSQPLYPSTDLYAFGATLYTMISGQVPVDSNNRRSVIEDREPDPLTPASAIGSSKYSPELLRAIDACLCISRKDRPQSVAELSGLLPTSWQSVATPSQPTPAELPKSSNSDSNPNAQRKLQRHISKNPDSKLIVAGLRQLLPANWRSWMAPSPPAPAELPKASNSDSKPDESQSVNTQRKSQRHISKNPDLQSIIDNDVFIRGGSFLMGSPEDEQGRYDDYEGPQRWVKVPDFYMARYPVTHGEYKRFAEAMGDSIDYEWHDPGFKQDDDHPMVNVSWDDAQSYIEWLNRETGLVHRLPSEAEWEYACRAGTSTRFWWGDDLSGKIALVCANFGHNNKGTTAVGSFKPNPWGLYDMSGNVWEWTQDCWHNSYEGAPSDGSAWLAGDRSERVLRGGSWNFDPDYLRSADRNGNTTVNRYFNSGFRLARTLA